jgi:hypothetical protein
MPLPGEPPGGMPGAPGAMPPGSPPVPGQPPIGSSPATGPTQNTGFAAKGVQAVGALLSGMAMVIPLVGPSTPLGQAIAKALVDIGKHAPPGSSTPQGENNFLQSMMQQRMQMGPHNAAMAAQGGAPPPPAAPPPMAA